MNWMKAAAERVSGLVSEAKEVQQIVNEMSRLMSACEELIHEHYLDGALLLATNGLGIDTSELEQALKSWDDAITDEPNLYSALGIDPKATEDYTENKDVADPLSRLTPSLTDEGVLEVAGRLIERGARVRAALVPLRERAHEELNRRENLWRPLHHQLRSWLPLGRRGKEAMERLDAVQTAEKLAGGDRRGSPCPALSSDRGTRATLLGMDGSGQQHHT